MKWEWYKRLDGSPIANIFMGQFKISLQCTICKNTSPTFEPFWDMGLPIDRVSSIIMNVLYISGWFLYRYFSLEMVKGMWICTGVFPCLPRMKPWMVTINQ